MGADTSATFLTTRCSAACMCVRGDAPMACTMPTPPRAAWSAVMSVKLVACATASALLGSAAAPMPGSSRKAEKMSASAAAGEPTQRATSASSAQLPNASRRWLRLP